MALIKTIRLLLSFLSGDSVNLFCLCFTLQNHLFRNILNLSNYPQVSHFITCDLLWKNKRIHDVYSNSEDYKSFLVTSQYNWSKDYQDSSGFAQTSGSLELSLSTTSTYSLGKFHSSNRIFPPLTSIWQILSKKVERGTYDRGLWWFHDFFCARNLAQKKSWNHQSPRT